MPDGRTVTTAQFLEWHEVRLAAELERATGVRVTCSNDLLALTEAEHWFGVGRDHDTFAVVTVGAGVGYGLVAHGNVIRNDSAGIGLACHVPLEPGGPPCSAGHRGCATAMLTTGSIVAQASVGLARAVDYDEVLRLAGDGEPVCSGIIRSAASALGRLAALAANFTFADTIVLAGEGIGLMSVAGDDVRAAVDAGREPGTRRVDLVVRDAGFTAWARGAAAVAIRDYVLGR